MDKTYDEKQTEACNEVRKFLQSIAIQAVQAQDCIGSDKCSDLLDDISSDLEKAARWQEKIVYNQF